jgi:thymidylate kinase
LPPKIGRERTGVRRSKKVKNDYGQSHLFDSPTVDQFDSRTLEYHKKVRKIFLQLDGVYPGVVKTIDVSSDSIEEVSEKIKKIIEETDF